MAQKGLPLLGEVLSRKTLKEALDIFEEIHQAIEAAGGTEITLAGLAAAGPALGLSESALEVVGLLAAGGVTIAAHLYALEAAGCLARAVTTNLLFGALDEVTDGPFKALVVARTESDEQFA
jgi:hypothetical protein